MTKYKILISGKNRAIVDDFFNQLNLDYEIVSSSERFADFDNHIDFFRPNILVLCFNGEALDLVPCMMELKRKITKCDIKVAIIGEQDECEDFQKKTGAMADMVMTKPITVATIHETIMNYMEELEEEAAEQQKELERQREEEERNRRKRILVVDDEPIMLKLIQEQLVENYDIATAISGKIALKFLEKKGADLILLDYEMPIESGPDVMRRIRSESQYDNIPIVFLTGVTEKEKIQEVLQLKPNGYILKPVDREKLLAAVDGIIGSPKQDKE